MRNHLGVEFGGSGVKLNAEKYKEVNLFENIIRKFYFYYFFRVLIFGVKM